MAQINHIYLKILDIICYMQWVPTFLYQVPARINYEHNVLKGMAILIPKP